MKDYERVYLEQKGGLLTTKQLAKELGKSESTVKKWLKQLAEETSKIRGLGHTNVVADEYCPPPEEGFTTQLTPFTPPEPSKKKRGRSMHLFARPLHKNDPSKPVGAIMTEAASMAGDDAQKVSTAAKNKYKNAIFKPFDE